MSIAGNGPTSIEIAVRDELDKRDIAYEFQAPVGRYLADFLVGSLVIECDGDYWHSRPGIPERDRERDEHMRSLGFDVVRLTETEINEDASEAVDRALEVLTFAAQ